MKTKMKKLVLVLSVLLMVSAPLKAQVFIMDDEYEGNLRNGESMSDVDWDLLVPNQALDSDQYLPLGDGWLLLLGLGGAYLLKKRNRED